jgi:hypothetical protein
MPLGTRITDPRSAEYNRDYNRGWKASEDAVGLDSLDHAGSSEAAYDGYHDESAGRLKWTYRTARRAGYDDMQDYLNSLSPEKRKKAMGM